MSFTRVSSSDLNVINLCRLVQERDVRRRKSNLTLHVGARLMSETIRLLTIEFYSLEWDDGVRWRRRRLHKKLGNVKSLTR